MGDETTDRTAVVVLGMHRSGTSALTGALGDLGVDLPNDQMAASPMNPKGFMESDSITSLDDELLAAAGTAWFDWRPFDVREVDSKTLTDFRDRAVSAVGDVYGDSALFALKDPRICRLVPFWTEVFEAIAVRPTFLCVHRHPAEVASSLDTWANYAPAYSGLLWLRYVLDAEHATRGLPRMFTSYAQVLDDWPGVALRAAEQLDVDFPVQDTDGTADFLDQNLRRAREDAGGIEISSPWVHTAYEILERWTAEGENAADHPALDELRATLDAVSPAIDGIVDSGREADIRARKLEKRIAAGRGDGGAPRSDTDNKAEVEKQTAGLRDRLQQVQDESAQLKQRLNNTKRELQKAVDKRDQLRERVEAEAQKGARAAQQLADVEAERDHLQAQVETEAKAHADVIHQVADLESERDHLQAQVETEAKAQADATQQAADLKTTLADSQQQLDRLRREAAAGMQSRITESITALQTAETTARNREAEYTALEQELERVRADNDRQLTTVQEDLEQTERRRLRAEEQLREVEDQLEGAREERREAQRQLVGTEEQVRNHSRQLDLLRRQAAGELRRSVAAAMRAQYQAEEEVAEFKAKLAAARQRRKSEERAFLESTSWRVTAPMRRVSEWMQRARSRTRAY